MIRQFLIWVDKSSENSWNSESRENSHGCASRAIFITRQGLLLICQPKDLHQLLSRIERFSPFSLLRHIYPY